MIIFFRIIFWAAFIYSSLGVIVYFVQEKLIFYPQKLSKSHKFNFQSSFEEFFYIINDKVTLNALKFKVPKSRGIIFYFHGNAGSLLGWGDTSSFFLDLGYDFLIYDYRGYGKSSGKIANENDLYNDAQEIYNSLKQTYQEDKIILYGRSMGTAIASHIAANNAPSKLILESPFYNMTDVARHHYPFLPTFLLRYKFDISSNIKKIKSPIYIFHGTVDEIIPVEISLKLKNDLDDKDEFILIDDKGHNEVDISMEYVKKMRMILTN